MFLESECSLIIISTFDFLSTLFFDLYSSFVIIFCFNEASSARCIMRLDPSVIC